MRRFPSILALLGTLFGTALPGCATRSGVFRDFVGAAPNPEKRTVILFLVDGLSTGILRNAMTQGKLPNTTGYFLSDHREIRLAHAVFPTLTYPNITSILTANPVYAHPVIGNRILKESGEEIPVESPFHQDVLQETLKSQGVFSRLASRGVTSVNLSFSFGEGATASYPKDLNAGLAYQRGYYARLDDKLIDSLRILLRRTPSPQWPGFIFIHLVGVDGLAHSKGPESAAVADYLFHLDSKLGPVYQALEDAQKNQGRNVIALLTADHGFVRITRAIRIEPWIRATYPEVRIVNQDRLISFYFPARWPGSKRAVFLASLRKIAGVEISAWADGNTIRVDSAAASGWIQIAKASCPGYDFAIRTSFSGTPDYRCPASFDQEKHPRLPPFFVSNTAAYFHSARRPDAVVLAGPGISFGSESPGQHGGPTPDEVWVPVLMRNAMLRSASAPPPSFELLRFLVQ